MLRYLIRKNLDAAERKLGAPVDYLRFIAATSLSAFFKFAMFMPLAGHRKVVPLPAKHIAHMVAARSEDCGECVQMAVNLARQDHVSSPVIRAVLNDSPGDLTPEWADVYHFARAICEQTGEEESLRARMRDYYGDEGLVELALGIASARLFPVTKRALGYSHSCSLVSLEGEINIPTAALGPGVHYG